jgi:hypothetical protein
MLIIVLRLGLNIRVKINTKVGMEWIADGKLQITDGLQFVLEEIQIADGCAFVLEDFNSKKSPKPKA